MAPSRSCESIDEMGKITQDNKESLLSDNGLKRHASSVGEVSTCYITMKHLPFTYVYKSVRNYTVYVVYCKDGYVAT